MLFHSGPTLEEISVQKQIRTKLEKCTYEQLYDFVTSYYKENKYPKNPFHPLNIIHSILHPSTSGKKAAEEYNIQMAKNLATEVIAEKYPDRKHPTQLEDYL